MNAEFMVALEQVEKEKGISRDILVSAIEQAISSACRKDLNLPPGLYVRLEQKTGKIHAFIKKSVVETVSDPDAEINPANAKKLGLEETIGQEVEMEVVVPDLGRIAAQAAKQVFVQRLREAERDVIYDEFKGKETHLVTGVVQRKEGRTIYVDLGRSEAILPAAEQISSEPYLSHERYKFYVVEVRRSHSGAQVVLSRTHPGLIRRLFEMEIPEIQGQIVEIKGIAREPGIRTKIAVVSRDPNVDPVGACVGPRGRRIQMIVDELRGEKIDIVPHSQDITSYITSALSPAKLNDVILFEEEKTAKIVVPDNALSLAIGKKGQNVMLAAKLVGWRVDILKESIAAEELEKLRARKAEREKAPEEVPQVATAEQKAQNLEILELSSRALHALEGAGIKTLDAMLSKSEKELLEIKGFGEKSLQELKEKLSEKNFHLNS